MDQDTFDLYMQALAGTLASAPTGAMAPVTIFNNLPIDVRISYITPFATHANMGVIPAGYAAVIEAAPGDYVLVTAAATGSMAGVISIVDGTTSAFFDQSDLLGPNDIGLPPVPTTQIPLPLDTPRVLVATGLAANHNMILREQYWMRSPDSFSILPEETQDISSTSTTAMQQTSSELDVMSASLGTSVSAGWGPVSASVSASLSTSSTTFQEVSVSTEHTSYTADHIKGTGDSASFYLKWQLTDVISVLRQSDALQLSSLITGQAPVLIGGPYSVASLDTQTAVRRQREGRRKAFPRNRLPAARALGGRSAS